MNKIKFSFCILLLSMILSLGSGMALDPKTLDNPYNELIGVMIEKGSSKTIKEDAEQQAIYEAFKRVLQKLLKNKYSSELVDKYHNRILSFVSSIKVLKETNSDDVYKGEYIVLFREGAINKILSEENNDTVISKLKTLLVPVYYRNGEPAIWGDNNLWMLSWEQILREGEGDSIILPIGDLEDIRDLSISDVMNGNSKKLEKFMEKYNAQKLVVSEAIFDKGFLEIIVSNYIFEDGKTKLDKESKHYNFSQATVDSINLKKDFLYAIASDVVIKMDKIRKIKQVDNVDSKKIESIESISVKYYTSNIKDYMKLRNIFKEIKFVKEVEFLEMSSQNVNMKLYYKGGMAGFISYLYRNGIKLKNVNNEWQMSFI